MGTVTLRLTAAPDATYSNKNAALTPAEMDANLTYFLRNDVSDSMTGSLTVTGNITAYSDIRIKSNIYPITDAIEKLKQITGVTFNRTDDPTLPRQAGVIAQEVEKILPEVITEDSDGIKSVAYGNMIALLIEAIKEQQIQIDQLKHLLNSNQ